MHRSLWICAAVFIDWCVTVIRINIFGISSNSGMATLSSINCRFPERTAFIWLIPIGLLLLGMAILFALQNRGRRQQGGGSERGGDETLR